jgi:regulator of replication initiation timing
MYYRDKNNEVAKLNSQVTELKSQQNLNIVDLQKQLDEVRQNNRNLDDENKQLRSDLNKANDRIAQLTPKDIRDLKIDSVIQINRAAGDAWQSPIYADINGDGKADGIYAYRLGGAGSFLNVYAYSYLDNTNPTQILKAEQYQKGEVSLQPDMTVDIKFQTGAPDSPETATAKFKWDSSAKKLVKI